MEACGSVERREDDGDIARDRTVNPFGSSRPKPRWATCFGPNRRRGFPTGMAVSVPSFETAPRTERACLWVRRAMPPPGKEVDRLRGGDEDVAATSIGDRGSVLAVAGAAAPDPFYFSLPVRSSATRAFSLRMNNRPPDTTGADHVNLSRSSTVHRLTSTYFFGSALARKSSP